MTKPSDNKPDLFQFTDALVDDLMSISDEELLKELREDGGDPDALAIGLRASIEARMLADGKAKLASARGAMKAALSARSNVTALSLTLNEKQQILERFAANDGQLRQRLTMAARKGEGASERELDDILRDLRELGAIDEKGNPC